MGLFNKISPTTIDPDAVLQSLSTVIDPDLHQDLVTLKMIRDLEVVGKRVKFTLELTTPSCPLKDYLERESRAAAEKVVGPGNVDINITARVPTAGQHHKNGSVVLNTVKNTIAVASGKGGVGKSTVAANLAVQLAKDGARVGLLDADIYGPSIPLMFGLQNAKPAARQVSDDKVKMVPLEAEGVKIISIGFLVEPDQAVVWRGPMASGALKQFMTDVDWGELDYLIFDLPPGTGDIQLTLVQSIALTGAVIVSTPQDVALADAKKAIQMFRKVHVPILGLVENMSYFECRNCGTREEIFAHGGGQLAAEAFEIPFLGELPLQTSVRIGGDDGKPIVASDPDSTAAKGFSHLSSEVARQISVMAYQNQEPIEIAI